MDYMNTWTPADKMVVTLLEDTFHSEAAPKMFSQKKIWGYNIATVSLITRKILLCDIESCYKNVSKIPNVTFNFQKR